MKIRRFAIWVVFNVLIPFVIVVFLAGCSNYAANDPVDDNKPTASKLSNAARVFNEKYFYGGLPINKTKIELTDNVEDDAMAHIDQLENGQWLIKISRKYNPVEKAAELSEAHELCHLEDRINERFEGLDGHEYAFQSCMQRLAFDGAFKYLW